MKLNIGFLLILSITIKVRAMSKVLKYRPDLDGIRALAVLSVIIFHIDPQWLPGGFLGVDMFFRVVGIFDHDHYQPRDSRRQFFRFSSFTNAAPNASCLSLPVYCFARRSLPPFSFCLSICANTSNLPSMPCCLPPTCSLPAAAAILMRMRRKSRCSTFGRCRWKNSFTLFSPRC